MCIYIAENNKLTRIFRNNFFKKVQKYLYQKNCQSIRFEWRSKNNIILLIIHKSILNI